MGKNLSGLGAGANHSRLPSFPSPLPPTPISTPTSAVKPEPKLSPTELQRILDDTEDEFEKAGYGMTCLELEEQRELDAALAAEAYTH